MIEKESVRGNLKQAQNDPFTVEDQTAIIYAGSKIIAQFQSIK